MTGDTYSVENVYGVLCVTGESMHVDCCPDTDLWEFKIIGRDLKDKRVAGVSVVLGSNEVDRLAHLLEAQLEDLSRRRKE